MVVDEKILRHLHHIERLSSIKIALIYNVNSRTVRRWLQKLGIENIGNTFQKGTPNLKNKNRIRSSEEVERWNTVNVGRTPHNKGCNNHEVICIVCEKKFSDKPYRRKKYCSRDCVINSRGKTHWRYKGAEPRPDKHSRGWLSYKDFIKRVRTRDNNKCKICNSRAKHVHHLMGWKENETLRFDHNNGISVCIPCHQEIHKICGRNNYSYLKFKLHYKIDIATDSWVRSAVSTF